MRSSPVEWTCRRSSRVRLLRLFMDHVDAIKSGLVWQSRILSAQTQRDITAYEYNIILISRYFIETMSGCVTATSAEDIR